jgi:hypothetical protein
MGGEEMAMENKNLRKVLEEEKKILAEQTEKWKARISRLEDMQKGEKCCCEFGETRKTLGELEGRFVGLEHTAKM